LKKRSAAAKAAKLRLANKNFLRLLFSINQKFHSLVILKPIKNLLVEKTP
jgi:hypothetical protein